MCGFVGAVGGRDSGVDAQRLEAAVKTLQHRGPDGSAVYVRPGVALGHARLAIIDRAHGDQPMTSADGRYVVVFNGEIYNHHTLRAELEACGYRFKTRCDTEVLLHLFDHLGREMVTRLEGMFAFAIIDRRDDSVFMARDRFGKKPLYYSAGGATLRFASSTDALLQLHASRPMVNPQALYEYLVFQYVPSPLSPYDGIAKLAPGQRALWRPGELAVETYWRPPVRTGAAVRADFNFDDLNQVRSLIRAAVVKRMESEVPLGIFLSGGVDSSVVVAEAAGAGITPATFSVGFNRAEYDETRYARQVAERFGTRHTQIVADEDVATLFDRFTSYYDEPFADSSALATLAVARAAKDHVTVVLTGDGGDEMFGGYMRYMYGSRILRARHRLAPAVTATGLACAAAGRVSGRSRLSTGGKFLRDPWKGYRDQMFHFSPGEAGDILQPDLAVDVDRSAPTRRMDGLWHRGDGSTSGLMFVDEHTYLPDDLLMKMDRATMAMSLEARSPLLDHALAEHCASFPDRWLFGRGTGKRILKEAYRSVLPAEVLTRSKMGFGVPIASWMRDELRPHVAELLLDRRAPVWEWLDPDAGTALVGRFLGGEDSLSRKTWNLLALAGWASKRR